ncbi:MAG: aldo/keto reductase [Pseudomonadota bacterium]
MTTLATPEGTARYRDRFVHRMDPGHFREREGLVWSSLGIGSYLGDPDDVADGGYRKSLRAAVQGGINVVDTAINYRDQRSERVFGAALAELIGNGLVQRDEIILCTKGGYIPGDPTGALPYPEHMKKNWFDTGLLSPEDVVDHCHALAPAFLEDQLRRSLENLGVDAVDVYYVHNPEHQFVDVSREVFMGRMRGAFEVLERARAAGRIRVYGLATWGGLRAPAGALEHLPLEALVALAREVGGDDHGLKIVQLPFNLAMLEAWTLKNQAVAGELVPLAEAAARLGITVVASASLLQADLLRRITTRTLTRFSGVVSPSHLCLRFNRAVPGITTSLVGMSDPDHVSDNLAAAAERPLDADGVRRIFGRKSQ